MHPSAFNKDHKAAISATKMK
jgi:hypothetical protein